MCDINTIMTDFKAPCLQNRIHELQASESSPSFSMPHVTTFSVCNIDKMGEWAWGQGYAVAVLPIH